MHLAVISTSVTIILCLMEHFLILGVQLTAFRLHAGRPLFKDLILVNSLPLQEDQGQKLLTILSQVRGH